MAPNDTGMQLDWISENLYTAVVADMLDSLGFRNQVMGPEIRPIYSGARITGRAATMIAVEANSVPDAPYSLVLDLLDSLVPGEVVVCSMSGNQRAGIWGELLSTHTKAKGGRGAIIGGECRDSRQITEMKFPVFCTGFVPSDSKGRLDVVEIRTKTMVCGVEVNNGDLVIADADGCVVVPQVIEQDVLAMAKEKVAGENKVRDILRAGASIKAVFDEYGIL